MRIAVIPNWHRNTAMALLPCVCDRLCSAGALVTEVLSPEEVSAALQWCDMAVAIGGDGTIVHVAKAAAAFGRPVLGINGGHLGFLAGLEKDELEALPRLLSGEYTIEPRLLLSVSVYKGATPHTYLAMNEAVVSRGALSRLVDLRMTANGRDLLSSRGDGAIFATPTGSTAYSLSAGGPVVDPAVDCLLVTPVCPHTVASRPVILPADTVVTVQATMEDDAFLTVDGEENIAFTAADRLTIRRADFTAKLIRLKSATLYNILEEKLIGRRTL